MAKAKSTTGVKASGVAPELLDRLEAVNEGIQDAQCMAVCVEYALLYQGSDVDPEIAVCVRKYLVNSLDALSYELVEIKACLGTYPRLRNEVEKAARPAAQS
jgi:hypothetical protein